MRILFGIYFIWYEGRYTLHTKLQKNFKKNFIRKSLLTYESV